MRGSRLSAAGLSGAVRWAPRDRRDNLQLPVRFPLDSDHRIKEMIVTTKELFQHAYGNYAVGAYNINNLEQTVGLFRGNLGKSGSNSDPSRPELSAPFILQISRGARVVFDKRFLEAMIRTADQVFPEAIFAVHLDHGTEEVCYDCIQSGFYSSVMIDASHEPLAKNIEITRAGGRAGPCQGHRGRGGAGAARRGRGGRRRQRVPDRSGGGRRVRREERLRLAGGGDRHVARGLQVLRPAGPAPRPADGAPKGGPAQTSRW